MRLRRRKLSTSDRQNPPFSTNLHLGYRERCMRVIKIYIMQKPQTIDSTTTSSYQATDMETKTNGSDDIETNPTHTCKQYVFTFSTPNIIILLSIKNDGDVANILYRLPLSRLIRNYHVVFCTTTYIACNNSSFTAVLKPVALKCTSQQHRAENR